MADEMSESDTLKLKDKTKFEIPPDHIDKRKMAADDDLGAETGYVSDSSLNSRKGTPPKLKHDQPDERLYINRRKTKSERDKRRSSRVSLIESNNNNSGSENSTSSLEQNQPRYRKRANSKRHENETKDNGYRRRASSKNASQLDRIDSMREPDPGIDPDIESKLKKLSVASTATIKMNNKDIYFGTWNPKERAVLDQVLNNIDLRPDHRKSFRDKLKRTGSKDGKKKEKINEEDISEVIPQQKYPFNNYMSKPPDKSSKKAFLGLFSGFKKIKNNMLRRHDRIDEQSEMDYFREDPLQDYIVPKKRKSIFKRLGKQKKEDDLPRRRAQSTNDYVRSVAAIMEPKTNLSKRRSGSTHSLKSLFARTKSVDNLNGAFEYFSNQNQVFQRTPSMTRLDKFASTEKLNNMKRSDSQKSLSHSFEPVQLTARELCYNDSMVYAHAKLIQPSTASQRSLNVNLPTYQTGYYDSDYDDFYRGYQSDRAPSVASAYPAYNHNTYYSDAECPSLRAHSSLSHHPSPLLPPRRLAYYHPHHGYFHHPHNPHGNFPPCYNGPSHRTSYIPPGYAPPGYAPAGCIPPGYATPGYATPGYTTPGYATPGDATPQLQSGYSSEYDYGHHQRQQFSMVPYQARRAIERSLSKNSAASNYSSNYGYQSESSFCDDEDVFSSMQKTRSPRAGHLHRNCSTSSHASQMSTVL